MQIKFLKLFAVTDTEMQMHWRIWSQGWTFPLLNFGGEFLYFWIASYGWCSQCSPWCAIQRSVNYLIMWPGSLWEWGEWEIRKMSRRKQRLQCNANNKLLKLCSEKKLLDYHSNKSQEHGMGSTSTTLKGCNWWREVSDWDVLCRGFFWILCLEVWNLFP